MLMVLAKECRWVRCPNCGFFIDKFSGCSSVRCRTSQRKKLVKENFDCFVSCKTTIDDIETKLTRIEEDPEGSGTTHLYNCIQGVSSVANRAFEPLFKLQAQTEKIRSVQGMLQRFRTLFNLPSTICGNISKGGYDLAVIEYRKTKSIVLPLHKDFDSVWCRGTVKETIFEPWMNSMKELGCKFLEGRKVTEFNLDEETGCISQVACGKESLEADAVILAVGISAMQDIIQNSATLCSKNEFLKVLNLDTIDLLTVKLRLDKKAMLSGCTISLKVC